MLLCGTDGRTNEQLKIEPLSLWNFSSQCTPYPANSSFAKVGLVASWDIDHEKGRNCCFCESVFSLSSVHHAARISTRAATPAPPDFFCNQSYPRIFVYFDIYVVSVVRIKKHIISIKDIFFNYRASWGLGRRCSSCLQPSSSCVVSICS